MYGNVVRRANSSSQWMQRQAVDPFVTEARKKGYVARSAFKLSYIDDRFGLFDPKQSKTVIDLGCSPGGWCQVIRERTNPQCKIIGVDLLPVRATVTNAVCLQGDFTTAPLQRKVLQELDGSLVDVITSDMCPNRQGGTQDRQRIAELQHRALLFSIPLLKEGGHFVCKVLGSKASFLEVHRLSEKYFLKTHICKPPASRPESDEYFLVSAQKLASPRAVAGGPGSRRSDVSYGLDDWPGFSRRPRTRR
ncbi:23S rRNA (uridine2552-2'-O)-methyltransferase [Angomonas deanei]|nr:23S rRNA (uridine2552-2'-O)-methyltransferase [Angomonas deanei]|eukprot:EPY38498.1 23S rRNA (uridine2552-2'-O)-methyltransferase [Angomonas deanei]